MYEWSEDMKKYIALILMICLTAAVLSGCGEPKQVEEPETTIANDEAVLGTWSEDYFDSGYTFNADGTGMDIFWQLPFTYTAYDGVITIVYDDTTYGKAGYGYTVDESSITMTQQSDSSRTFTYTKSN